MTCNMCGKTFDYDDDTFDGEATHDDDWQADLEQRCYGCYLNWVYEMYGGWMEPVFTIGGRMFCADGEIS